VVEITLEEAHGKVPVVAGAGGYDTAEVAHAAREYEAMGVSGILSVSPYYNKPTQGRPVSTFFASLPVPSRCRSCCTTSPARTGVNIEPATVKRLSAIDTIVGVN